MNTKALVFAVTAACLTSGAAFAQSYDYRNDGYERGTQYQRGAYDHRYDRDGDGRADRDDRGEQTHHGNGGSACSLTQRHPSARSATGVHLLRG